jgi:hypothetical protein
VAQIPVNGNSLINTFLRRKLDLINHQLCISILTYTPIIKQKQRRKKEKEKESVCIPATFVAISSCSFSTLTVSYSLNIGAHIEVWSSVTTVDVSSASGAIYGIAKEEIITILAREKVITNATI